MSNLFKEPDYVRGRLPRFARNSDPLTELEFTA